MPETTKIELLTIYFRPNKDVFIPLKIRRKADEMIVELDDRDGIPFSDQFDLIRQALVAGDFPFVLEGGKIPFVPISVGYCVIEVPKRVESDA